MSGSVIAVVSLGLFVIGAIMGEGSEPQKQAANPAPSNMPAMRLVKHNIRYARMAKAAIKNIKAAVVKLADVRGLASHQRSGRDTFVQSCLCGHRPIA
jgi:hypothetical protein